jgi:hypothetical protein
MIKIEVNHDELKRLGKFLTVVIKDFKTIDNRVGAKVPAIAEAVGTYIWSRILEEHPKKPRGFMADRTQVTYTKLGSGQINIRFSGIQLEGDNANLWEAWEYGFETGDINRTADQGPIAFYKDHDADGNGIGDPIIVYSRKSAYVDKYAGVIDAIIEGSLLQIQRIVYGLAGAAVSDAVGEVLKDASEGKLKISSGARKILRNAGVNSSDLANLGITSASVNPLTGGISLRGSQGRFMANPKSLQGVRIK